MEPDDAIGNRVVDEPEIDDSIGNHIEEPRSRAAPAAYRLPAKGPRTPVPGGLARNAAAFDRPQRPERPRPPFQAARPDRRPPGAPFAPEALERSLLRLQSR
ncbi:MAG: hypothetical protein V8Q84_00635 [Bilophila sp.]